MEKPVLVTVYTQVYNTKPWLRQCIESVLTQTYPYFEYYVVDNGSTDGCKEILEEYAAADSRIHLDRNEENMPAPPGAKVSVVESQGRYYTMLDSDDWWESDYLERLVSLAESQNLDIVCTGSVTHNMVSGNDGIRAVERTMILSRKEFPEYFPWYHVFFRPHWGKLSRIEYIRAEQKISYPELSYGLDTVICLRRLQLVQRIGISNSVLYHYRIYPKSLSYQYFPDRFRTDVYLYNDAIDLLSGFGPVSAQNLNFIQCVYSNALIDTTGVIQNSPLSPAEKLREYRTISQNPITLNTYRKCTDVSAVHSKAALLQRTLEAGAALGKKPDDDLRFTVQTLLPRCGQVVTAVNAQLFLMDARLFRALLQEDQNSLLQILLDQIKKNQGVKKFALPATIQALTMDNPLLCQIDDAVFLRKYGEVYWKTWQGEYMTALNEMTGMLLEKRINGGQETFLHLYISLSAVMEQPPAFIFGKIQLAWFYLRQSRLEECRTIVADLTEMGVESEDLDMLRLEMNHLPGK